MKDMKELNYSKIGQRIRQARKKKGWTQGVLASRCGICISFMGHIERGTRYMSLDTFVSICDSLEMDADELLWGVLSPRKYGLPDMWAQKKFRDTDHYLMYVQIMKSVAEIMSGTKEG